MSETVIQLAELSKHYRLGSISARTLSADLNRRWAMLRGRPDPYTRMGQQPQVKNGQNGNSNKHLWALKNVSFEVKRGEVLGIIGRNGAGKSTLLKIMSRVTAPTSGEVRVKGRTASLLEVGTGFHPELTGRENIFLNGAILGMTKGEITSKFDEIVSFSEVGKFIDTPVKRYSTGMYVRLAFAVAAHLEPEILIVDEVLAVGDLNFQRKCLGKMGEVARDGRTVLFVSHNLAAVVQLCHRGIVLVDGTVHFEGTSRQSVDFYAKSNSRNGDEAGKNDGAVRFENLRVNGSVMPAVAPAAPLEVTITLKGPIDGNPLIIMIMENASGQQILHERMTIQKTTESSWSDFKVRISIPALFLSTGLFSLYLKGFCTSRSVPVRMVSERLPIEVTGESDSLGSALLAPAVTWHS